MNTDYYSIAINDMGFCLSSYANSRYYNNIATACQQATEKLLKSIAELVCPAPEKILQSHNLRLINDEISKNAVDLKLNKAELAFLKDFYFESRYPGDNFSWATKEDCEQCISIMMNVYTAVNNFRVSNGLDVSAPPEITQDFSHSADKI